MLENENTQDVKKNAILIWEQKASVQHLQSSLFQITLLLFAKSLQWHWYCMRQSLVAGSVPHLGTVLQWVLSFITVDVYYYSGWFPSLQWMLSLITVDEVPRYSWCPLLKWMLSLITVDLPYYTGCFPHYNGCSSLQWMSLITVNAVPHYSECPSLQWMLFLITVDVLHYSGCCPSLQWMLSFTGFSQNRKAVKRNVKIPVSGLQSGCDFCNLTNPVTEMPSVGVYRQNSRCVSVGVGATHTSVCQTGGLSQGVSSVMVTVYTHSWMDWCGLGWRWMTVYSCWQNSELCYSLLWQNLEWMLLSVMTYKTIRICTWSLLFGSLWSLEQVLIWGVSFPWMFYRLALSFGVL